MTSVRIKYLSSLGVIDTHIYLLEDVYINIKNIIKTNATNYEQLIHIVYSNKNKSISKGMFKNRGINSYKNLNIYTVDYPTEPYSVVLYRVNFISSYKSQPQAGHCDYSSNCNDLTEKYGFEDRMIIGCCDYSVREWTLRNSSFKHWNLWKNHKDVILDFALTYFRNYK